MKNLVIALTIILMVPVAASAFPYDWTFEATAGDGVGSATMSFVDNGSFSYVATINNTSPTTLTGGGVNSPGIDGFGFFLDQDNNKNDPTPPPSVVSWSLTGFTSNASGATSQVIGSDSIGPWVLEYNQDNTIGIKFLDYYTSNDGGVSYALYNPLAVNGFGDDPYFTEAVLTLNLSSALEFAEDGGAFVRMQNVGRGGEYSLKIFNDDSGIPPQLIPEPSTFVLLFAGLFGLAVYRRKKG